MKLSQVVESLLFASHDPLSTKSIVKAIKDALKEVEEGEETVGKATEEEVTEAIEELNRGYARQKRAFVLTEGPLGWRVYTRPEYGTWVRQLFPGKKPPRLSPPALETLAIIAYRQPITKADIEAVRGVSVDGVLQTVMDRGLVRIDGRADVPGRPLLYGTTLGFLEHFGIKNVDDLPNSAELRRVALPTAAIEGEGESESASGGGEGVSGEGEGGAGDVPVEKQLALAAAGPEAQAAGASGEGAGATASEGEGHETGPAGAGTQGGEEEAVGVAVPEKAE